MIDKLVEVQKVIRWVQWSEHVITNIEQLISRNSLLGKFPQGMIYEKELKNSSYKVLVNFVYFSFVIFCKFLYILLLFKLV